ncbi:MAG: DUF2848 family protein [Pseudomonadota bacterium]|nr:DUF2848 family protein [Pseudomonadota bacterium]
MASSFIYRPHVHNLDNVSTPDVLLDHLLILKGEETAATPIDRLTTNVEIQVVGGNTQPDAAFTLIGAGAGTLLSVASNHGNQYEPINRLSSVKPISRQAWRMNDIGDNVANLVLRSFAINLKGEELIQEGIVGEVFGTISNDVPLGNIQILTGLNLNKKFHCDNFRVEIEDPILSRKLTLQYRVQEI